MQRFKTRMIWLILRTELISESNYMVLHQFKQVECFSKCPEQFSFKLSGSEPFSKLMESEPNWITFLNQTDEFL